MWVNDFAGEEADCLNQLAPVLSVNWSHPSGLLRASLFNAMPDEQPGDAIYNKMEARTGRLFLVSAPRARLSLGCVAHSVGCAQSHVSGGFWLQLSSPLTDALPDVQGGVKAVSCAIIAGIWAAFFQECQRESCAQVLQESVSMDEWEVVWLRKGRKGGGLSGGWRGFAIDMELSAGNHHRRHHNPTLADESIKTKIG